MPTPFSVLRSSEAAPRPVGPGDGEPLHAAAGAPLEVLIQRHAGPVKRFLGFLVQFLQRLVAAATPEHAESENHSNLFHVIPWLPRGVGLPD